MGEPAAAGREGMDSEKGRPVRLRQWAVRRSAETSP